MLALLLGSVVFLNFIFPTDVPLTVSCFWLAANGAFLIARRNVPMTRNAKTLFIFNFCLCSVLLIGAGVPNFIKVRSTSCCNACVNILGQIDAAVNEFALENHKTNGEAINFPNDLTPYIQLRDGKIPSCPLGGIYHISKVGETPTCSLGTTVTPAHVLP